MKTLRLRIHLTLLLLVAFLLPCQLYGQLPVLRNFDPTTYGAGTQSWNIAQDASDIVYFANNSALLTFDGLQWRKHYVSNYTAVRSLLHDDSHARIYVGATDEFGYFAPDTTGREIRFHSLLPTLPDSGQRVLGEVWNIIRTPDSLIVFQTKTHLMCYDGTRTTAFVSPHRIETTALVDGQIVVACKEGIYTFLPPTGSGGSQRVSGDKGNRFRRMPGTDALVGTVVKAVLPLATGGTMFVTANHGLFVCDGDETRPFQLDITPFLTENHVFCAATDGRSIAFGTVRGGVVVRDLATGHNTFANRLTGLRDNTVLAAAFDRHGNIWLGLNSGLSYLTLESSYRNLVSAQHSIGTGYTSMLKGNLLYLGTNQGLYTLDYPLQPSPIPAEPRLVPGMVGQVWTLRDIDGVLLCASDLGAYVVNGQTARRIDGPEGTWDFLPLRSHPGLVLACDYQSFYVLQREGSGFRMRNRIDDFSLTSGGFLEDAEGAVWVSHWQRGIYRITLDAELCHVASTEHFHKNHGLVSDDNNMLCTIDGNIYVSSVDGFYRYDSASRKLVHADDINQYFQTYGTSLRIVQTSPEHIWAYKPGYLGLLHRTGTPGTVDVESYSMLEGQLQMTFGTISPLDSAHTLFNTLSGFAVVSNRFQPADTLGAFFIRSVTSINAADSLLYFHSPNDSQHTVRVPHELNSLRIEFVQPEYREQNAVVYSYCLEGYDKQWSLPQNTCTKEYTRLPHGHYTFRVKATNHITGRCYDTQIDIEVLPAWYENTLAYIIYVLLAAVLIYLVMRYMKHRAYRELRRLKAEQEKQLREQQQQFEFETAKRETEMVQLRNQQLETELKHRSSELADSTMNLVQKNDMLQALDDSLGELLDSVRREDTRTRITKQISDIRNGIRENMNDGANWNKFEENFNLVYDNFMQKLTARFPDLKTSDRKLCAYLRMGLSSKEIASLLNTSVRSVETARYRLRKKLGIETGDNLTSFIQTFDGQS